MNYKEKCQDILFDGVSQISEQVFRFVDKYSNSAMLKDPPANEFLLVVGIGGDQNPPPILESYAMQPLMVLAKLQALKAESKIFHIPKLVFVFSYNSQVIENHRDKAGNPIRPSCHIYNSRISMERIHNFVVRVFPQLIDYCLFLEFPAYDRYSLARLFFATLWQYQIAAIPDGERILDTLFAIKGDVLDSQIQSQDLFQAYFVNFNAYPPRHLFTNLLLSPAHTLRYGSDRTECSFHLVASNLVKLLRTDREKIKEIVFNHSCHLYDILRKNNYPAEHLNCQNYNFELMLTAQMVCLPPSDKIYAQIGMAETHAAYYKHRGEPSLQHLVSTRQYLCDTLREEDRGDKADKLEGCFSRVTSIIGHAEYLDFLKYWNQFYCELNVGDEKIAQLLNHQKDRVQEFLMPTYEARKLMGYWL